MVAQVCDDRDAPRRRPTLEEDVAALLWRTTQFEVQLEELDRRKVRLRAATAKLEHKHESECELDEPTWTRVVVTRRALYLTGACLALLVVLLGRIFLGL